MSAPARTLRAQRGLYFFVSYARSAPTPGGARNDADRWVRVFYQQLSDTVRRMAKPLPELEIGFYDELLPAGSDWGAELEAAIGRAEVFVPLYSRGYLTKPWPQRERLAFQRRLDAVASATEGRGHVQPVLWLPVAPGDGGDDVEQALALGADVPDYADNGLRGLCAFPAYRDQYWTMVERLAGRVVNVAERQTLGPSVVTRLGDIKVSGTPFVVAVYAPTQTSQPSGRRGESYGTRSSLWRPFGAAQAQPIAESAVQVAQRLGLPTKVVDFTDHSVFDASPGVLLVDPWVAAREGGENELRALAAALPNWVVPLVVVDRNDAQFRAAGEELGERVMGILSGTEKRRIPQVCEVEEFVQLMPVVITDARRRYLRRAPVFPPKGPYSERPVLRSPNRLTPRTQEQVND